MFQAVKANLEADSGYCSEEVFEHLKDHRTELVVALGCEGKEQVKIDASQCVHLGHGHEDANR